MTEVLRPHVQVEHVEGVAIVHFLDHEIHQVFGESNDVEEIGRQLTDLVEVEGRLRLVLDLGEVEIMATALQAKLLTLDKRLRSRGGVLMLCALRPQVARSFRLTGLYKRFAIVENLHAALDALADAP
jgi:stage II sporulation protein AA (anti-sigma F factor antagonist)